MTAVSRADFWNQRYLDGDMGWDLGEPSPPLLALHQTQVIAPCRVAIPGCGNGWEVVWAASQGYTVTAIDFAPQALAALRTKLDGAGVDAALVCADLFNLPEPLDGGFDLVLEQTCFCAIDPARRPEYVRAVRRLLKPGGRLVGLFYACGGESGPPFTTTPKQVRELFGEHFEIDSLSLTAHSHPRRAGEEWLGVLLRR